MEMSYQQDTSPRQNQSQQDLQQNLRNIRQSQPNMHDQQINANDEQDSSVQSIPDLISQNQSEYETVEPVIKDVIASNLNDVINRNTTQSTSPIIESSQQYKPLQKENSKEKIDLSSLQKPSSSIQNQQQSQKESVNMSSIQKLLSQRSQIKNLRQDFNQSESNKQNERQQPKSQQSNTFNNKSTFQEETKDFNPVTSSQQQKHSDPVSNLSKGKQNMNSEEQQSSPFECNICLDTAKSPVVTQCGHLYCWPCIYQWLQQPKTTLVCPVCKSGISQDNLIPIYTKGNSDDPRKKDTSIPGRPQGQRSEPQQNQNYQNQNGIFGAGNQSQFMMGMGIFPSLFSLNFTWDNIGADANMANANAANNEETREQQMQRLLGVFVFFLMFCFMSFGGDIFLAF